MQTQMQLSEAVQLADRSRRRWIEVAVQVTDATGGWWRCSSSSSLVPSGAEGGSAGGGAHNNKKKDSPGWGVGVFLGGHPLEHPHFSFCGDPVTFGAQQTPEEPTDCVSV